MDRTKEIRNGDDIYSFDEVKHVHMLNGKRLTGVTTLIDSTLAKPALMPWAVKMCVEYIKENCTFLLGNFGELDAYQVTVQDLENAKKAHTKKKTDAGDWGTRVHHACEVWARTGAMPDPGEDIYVSVSNFVDFIQNNGFKILDIEKSVWSKDWWIGGIFDLILEKDGLVYIADIKTSSGIYDSHFIQMGAYYKCLVELDWVRNYIQESAYKAGQRFSGAIVINLKKDDTIQHCTSSALDSMVETYEGIVTIYRNRATLESITKAVKKGLGL